MSDTDHRFMAMALRLAEKGRYSVGLNPCVGCVLVRNDKVVGRGYHIRAGRGHAEANALEVAGDAAAGATAYVTLEPCSFEGRTPSCAEALIKAGVERVVVAMLDPDPRNAGKGIECLKAAGIEVSVGLLESSAFSLNRGHVKRHTQGLPFVRLKIGMSLDGKTALANGDSKWITSESSRADVQRLRAMSSAIVTGVQTAIDDDPRMDVRDMEALGEHAEDATDVSRPVFILDPNLRISHSAKLLQRKDTVLVCAEDKQASSVPVEVLTMPRAASGIDLEAILRELARREYNDVLFECGPTLAASLVRSGLVDEIVIYIAPVLMGATARSLLNLPEIDRMSDLVNLEVLDLARIGEDIRLTLGLK